MKNIFKIFIVTLLLSFVIVNIKVYQSAYWQTFTLNDINSDSYLVPYEIVGKKISDNFPNITHTALPMKYVKARYLVNMDSLDQAKAMLYKALKMRPQHMAPIQLLGSIYLKEKNYDSAYTLSRIAFNKMPNVNSHRATYFEVLRKLKKTDELDEAFAKVKDKSESINHWYDYIFSKAVLQNDKDEQTTLINEFKEKFPGYDTEVIEDLNNMISIGSRSYTIFAYMSSIGDTYFKEENYVKASEFYELALKYNQENYLLYENLAIAYDSSKRYSKAEEYYDIVMNQFNPSDGRVEFYKGLLLIKTGNMDDGCMLLRKSVDKNFILKTSQITASNALVSLCSNN